MPIKLSGTVETLDNVPESYRDRYEQQGDKYYLKEIEFDDPAEFRSKLQKKEKLLTETNAKLGRYSKLQELDDDELDNLLELREMKKQGKPLTTDEKAELERLHKKQADKLAAELNAEREARKADQAQLKRFKLTDPIRAIATSEKVGMFPEDFDLAWAEIGSRFQLVEEEGRKSKIVVLDEDGDETDIKVEDFFIKLYSQQRPKFFKASDSGGSGAAPNHRSKVLDRDLSNLSAVERMKLARRMGNNT
ncbi:MAG: hypothetical protein IPM55_22125 [Acidobacteria bacterium]|nr:hypothetical protein [Acidobacteriota bacterium]